jgi:hypothetical protein
MIDTFSGENEGQKHCGHFKQIWDWKLQIKHKITDENSVKYISAGQEWFQTYSYVRIPRPLLSSTTNWLPLGGQTDPSSSVKYLVMSTATCVNNFSGHTKCKIIISFHVTETNNHLTQSANTALKAASFYTQHEQSSHFLSSYTILPSLRSSPFNPLKGTMHAQHKEISSSFQILESRFNEKPVTNNCRCQLTAEILIAAFFFQYMWMK